MSTFSSATDPHKYKEALHQIDKKNCIKFKCSIVQVSPEGISVEEPFDVCFLNWKIVQISKKPQNITNIHSSTGACDCIF